MAGATTVGLDHTFVGDLAGTLIAPGGTTVTLFERDGGGGNNFCRTVFDDSAAVPFSVAVTADAPYTGSWRPEDPLASLLSEPVDGDWRFKVIDAAAGRHGQHPGGVPAHHGLRRRRDRSAGVRLMRPFGDREDRLGVARDHASRARSP